MPPLCFVLLLLSHAVTHLILLSTTHLASNNKVQQQQQAIPSPLNLSLWIISNLVFQWHLTIFSDIFRSSMQDIIFIWSLGGFLISFDGLVKWVYYYSDFNLNGDYWWVYFLFWIWIQLQCMEIKQKEEEIILILALTNGNQICLVYFNFGLGFNCKD